MLAYVDATIYKIIERLKSVVKIEVTADLNRDASSPFWVDIRRQEESFSFGMDAVLQKVYDEVRLSKTTVKPSAIPPMSETSMTGRILLWISSQCGGVSALSVDAWKALLVGYDAC